jgi:putative NADPH-quinone reductase
MNVLLVHAHPDPDSFNHSLVAAARRGLESAGHTVTALDLYGLNYQAVMNDDEWRAYETDSPVRDPLVAEHVALVRSSDAMIFVYPTWWSAMPAIMRGWLERTMLLGVAFEFDKKRRLTPQLNHIKHLIGISTHGSPWWYVKLVNDNGRRMISRTLRFNGGLRTKVSWHVLYAMDRRSPVQRQRFLDRIEKKMGQMR